MYYVLNFQGKSALWSHLLQYQEREEKQEHNAESPGEYLAIEGRVHCSKLTWTWEEQCNHTKSMQDFHCICLLISHLYFESFLIIVKMLHWLDKIDWHHWRQRKKYIYYRCLKSHLMSVRSLLSLLISTEWGGRSSTSASDDFWRSWRCGAVAKAADIFLSVSIISLYE